MAAPLPQTPFDTAGIGVVAPYDFALDGELWRWAPPGVAIYVTRTQYADLPVGVEQALTVGTPVEVAQLARNVSIPRPGVAAYACTSGSFCRGVAGERALTAAMVGAGFPAAVTTSGALAGATRALGVKRLATVTPYDEATTGLLTAYLAEIGVQVTASRHMGLARQIWEVSYEQTAELVRQAVAEGEEPDAVFISCTNLRTYDLIGPMEEELGIPVLTANSVTMWGALAHLGLSAVGDGALGRTAAGLSSETKPANP